MYLFPDAELASLAVYFGGLAFKDSVDILRSARTPDGQRGWRETYPVHETVNALVVSTGLPRLEAIAEQTTARNENLFCFPPGTDILRTDRLQWNGDLYEIIDLLDPSTYTVFLRVVAKHMEAGSGT